MKSVGERVKIGAGFGRHRQERTVDAMESLLRVGFLLLAGGLLLLANVWFVQTVVQGFLQRGLVIAPFEVVGGGPPELGRTFANLLQARLRQLQADLQRSQSILTSMSSAPTARATTAEAPSPEGKPLPPIPALWAQPINLNAALFEPVDINVSVGGVAVGRLVPWLQRAVVSPRLLSFTVSQENGKTVIAGDVRALNGVSGNVWIETDTTAPTRIVDLLAHELILRQVASDPRNRLAALDPQEFQLLTATLFETVRLNNRIARGRPVRPEFARVLPEIDKLVDKVPDWSELLFLAASIAENAGAREKALQFYTRLDAVLGNNAGQAPANADQRTAVALKVKELRTALPEAFYADLGRKIVALTGLFEFGSDAPERLFGTVIGEVGREPDIAFGVASWSFRTGTLPPLLRELQRTDPVVFRALLGDGADEIETVLAGGREVGLAFARGIQDEHRKVKEPWRSRFEALGREPKFQDVQMRTLEPFFKKAVALADEYGLRSERGLAQCFNVIFVAGHISRQAKEAIAAAVGAFEQEHRRPPGEVDRLRIIANAVADRTVAIVRENIRRRYLVIAKGAGPTPGGPVDLDRRGIRLIDFRTKSPIADVPPG